MGQAINLHCLAFAVNSIDTAVLCIAFYSLKCQALQHYTPLLSS
jgi:hypothetical protein